MCATFQSFCFANDTAAATSGKLAKQRTLAKYFVSIEDDADLKLAVRYAGGRAFAATDEHVLGASGAIVTDAAMALWKIDYPTLRAAAIRLGELGEALASLCPPPGTLEGGEGGGRTTGDALHLADLAATFDDIAATGNQQRKRELVQSLFARCQNPREIAYLCKIIFSDLRTGVREGVLQAAVAQAFGKTTAEIQSAQFLIGDLEEVAVLARRDRLAEARFTLFHPIQFMLATPKETAAELEAAFAGREFCAEDKLDGIRAQVHKQGEGPSARIAIYTRTMDRIDDSFPEIVAQMKKLHGDFLLDGEIVAYRDGAVESFAHLQQRLGRKNLTARVLRQFPAAFVAFDVLYQDGLLLIDRPLRQRCAALDHLLGLQSAIRNLKSVPVRTTAEITTAFAAARDRLNEGLVLKDPDSPYSPGRRGQMWFKLKTHLPTLDCVVTAAEYGHGKRRGSLSDYTFAVWSDDPNSADARLVNIGKAYSGVTDQEIKQLTELFISIATATNGRVFQVKPQVVLEIAMDQIQRSQRHESGFALRFPRIKRIRWDKSPMDADRLDRVKEIFAARENITRKESAPAQSEQPGLFDSL